VAGVEQGTFRQVIGPGDIYRNLDPARTCGAKDEMTPLPPSPS